MAHAEAVRRPSERVRCCYECAKGWEKQELWSLDESLRELWAAAARHSLLPVKQLLVQDTQKDATSVAQTCGKPTITSIGHTVDMTCLVIKNTFYDVENVERPVLRRIRSAPGVLCPEPVGTVFDDMVKSVQCQLDTLEQAIDDMRKLNARCDFQLKETLALETALGRQLQLGQPLVLRHWHDATSSRATAVAWLHRTCKGTWSRFLHAYITVTGAHMSQVITLLAEALLKADVNVRREFLDAFELGCLVDNKNVNFVHKAVCTWRDYGKLIILSWRGSISMCFSKKSVKTLDLTKKDDLSLLTTYYEDGALFLRRKTNFFVTDRAQCYWKLKRAARAGAQEH